MPAPRWSPIPPGEVLLAGRFVAAPGYRTWRPQGTCDWELLLTHAGAGLFAGGLRTAPGDLVLIRPGTPHDYATAPGVARWDNAWIHVLPRPGWDDLLDWPSEPVPGHLVRSLPPGREGRGLRTLFAAIARDAGSPLPTRRRLAVTRCEELLLRLRLAGGGGDAEGRLDPRIRLVLDHLGGDLRRPLPRDTLARLAGLSPSRLSHLFRAEVGSDLTAWRERQRLQRAADLLDADAARTVAAIAAEVGYADPFYFSARFARWAGMSPRAWRRRPRRAPALRREPAGHIVGMTLPPHTGR